MDMNKILQNFENAANGEYKPSKQESSDMKMILESFNKVAADDATPQQLDEIASVSVSGETADEVAQLVRLMNNAGAPEAAPVGAQPTTMHEPSPCGGPPDMPPKDTMITPKMMDDFESGEEPVEEGDAKEIMHRKAEREDREDFVADAGEMGMSAEEAGEFWDATNGETESYENEPDERYNDHETMTHDLSGGLNRRKKSYKRAEPGDNPMAVESSLKEELSKMLKKKMSEQDQDGDGDEDFADVQIARMVASGMSKDEAIKKVKNKKYNEAYEMGDDDAQDMQYFNAIAALYGDDIWNNDDMVDLAQELADADPSPQDLAYIISNKKLPKHLADIKFSNSDQIQFREADNATDGKTETINIGWGEEVEVKHTPQGRLLIGEDIPAQVYHSGHGGENVERFIDFVYNMDTKKVIEWPEKMSDEYEELDKEAFLDVVDWIAIDVQTKLKEKSVQKGSKKDSDTEVDEAEKKKKKGPCWSGYKMVGTKKKGGKEVPNCVPEGVEEAAPKKNNVARRTPSHKALKDLGTSGAGGPHRDKSKYTRKYKHKVQMESAPVFDRYVKPLLDKSPKQIIEFYDTEAYAIIDRLSRESRILAKQNVNTRVHDSIVGKLRENLSVLPETKLDEMRRRRSS